MVRLLVPLGGGLPRPRAAQREHAARQPAGARVASQPHSYSGTVWKQRRPLNRAGGVRQAGAMEHPAETLLPIQARKLLIGALAVTWPRGLAGLPRMQLIVGPKRYLAEPPSGALSAEERRRLELALASADARPPGLSRATKPPSRMRLWRQADLVGPTERMAEFAVLAGRLAGGCGPRITRRHAGGEAPSTHPRVTQIGGSAPPSRRKTHLHDSRSSASRARARARAAIAAAGAR